MPSINTNVTVSIHTGGIQTDIRIANHGNIICQQINKNGARHSLMVGYG